MRITSSMQYEAARAALSTAGIRLIKQAKTAVGAGAEANYTVTEANTRRVMIIFIGTVGDILFDYNHTAAATDFPLTPGEYLTVDAEKGDSLSFWNTTGGGVDVFTVELE